MTRHEDDTEPTDGGFKYVPPDDDEPVNPLEAALDALRQQQRFLAGFDFSALSAAQSAIADIGSMHDDLAQALSASVDFTVLQRATESMQAAVSVASTARLTAEWAQQFARAFDFSALAKANEIILSNAAIRQTAQRQLRDFAAIPKLFDYSALTKQWRDAFQATDWDLLRTTIRSWLPANLRRARDLQEIAQLCLDEGLPLAWVPRHEIVRSLVEAKTPKARRRILEERFLDILDDCESAVREITHDWADQCRSAIATLRQPDLEGPAQSHAANIIDSIVVTILGRKGRDVATKRAKEPYGNLPLRVAVENIVLRPLVLGFAHFRPARGDPIPNHFARHATAHAVGQPGVFTREYALVGVMLATSLTVQFWQDSAAPPALGTPAP